MFKSDLVSSFSLLIIFSAPVHAGVETIKNRWKHDALITLPSMTEIASVAKYMLVTQIVKREQNLCLCYDNRVKLLKTDHNCFLLY